MKHREWTLLGAVALMFTAFALTTDGFADPFSLMERTRYWVATGLIMVPMVFIIATAGIDLSVGSIVALAGVVMGLLYRDAGWPIWAAACGALLTGLFAGALNGFVSAAFGVAPLVTTLATMALFRGFAMALSQARPISGFPASFDWLSQGDLMKLSLGDEAVYIPFGLVFMLGFVFLGAILLKRTWFGRFTESLGENPIAARFAGIPNRWMTFALYTASGLVCGIASIFYTALYATARPGAGKGLELEVIACVVIGGTRISGGRGSVVGGLLGLIFLGTLRYGLEMAGLPGQYLAIVVGILLVVMVMLNEWTARKALDRR